MLRFAEPLPPISAFARNDLDEFLSEAVALAERINRRLSERASLPAGESPSSSIEPVEN